MTAHGGYHKWSEADRRKWQDPEAILSEIGLHVGLTFMDIGCGDGFFALPASRLAGERGTVYALDSDADAIERLRAKAAREGLGNLSLHVGEAERLVLCQACADIIFFGTVLHDFREPATVLTNAKQMLKPGGKLVNLDWKKEQMSMGPPLAKRFSEEQAQRLIVAAGFKVTTQKDSGRLHYLIVATP